MDAAHARELLSRERARIEASLGELQRSEDQELSQVGQHPADSGTELFQRESDEGLATRLHEELAAIERAEARVEDGTYGTSVESGEPIPDARLEAMPWAERTVAEQERLDQH